MMCVGNDNDLMEVGQAALAAMPSGTTLVDHTTASADAARKLYAIAKAKGIAFIDGPVSGGQLGRKRVSSPSCAVATRHLSMPPSR